MDQQILLLYRSHHALHVHDRTQNHIKRYRLCLKYLIVQEWLQLDRDLYQGMIQLLHHLPYRLLQRLTQVLLIEVR